MNLILHQQHQFVQDMLMTQAAIRPVARSRGALEHSLFHVSSRSRRDLVAISWYINRVFAVPYKVTMNDVGTCAATDINGDATSATSSSDSMTPSSRVCHVPSSIGLRWIRNSECNRCQLCSGAGPWSRRSRRRWIIADQVEVCLREWGISISGPACDALREAAPQVQR